MAEVSVIIRCKNESAVIEGVLSMVFAQKDADFEVIVVDSGSTDDTLSIVGRFDARLLAMPPEDFTYGRAMNLGIANASGSICVFLSAHAVPFDRHWLRNIVAPMNDPAIAATAGKLMPHGDCNPFDRRGLLRRYPTDRFYLTPDSPTSYSHSNAALRKDVLARYPIDETIPYAEDLHWMRRVIDAGYKIFYEPTAAVYHSHNETSRRLASRFRSEAQAQASMGRRYTLPGLAFDALAGSAYDLATVIAAGQWAWLGAAVTRRFWMNLGRYRGGRMAGTSRTELPISR